MSKFNLNTNHPLIPNANQYLDERKYVSIHSEDRDIIKYPNSSEFEVELPQDYLNVQSISLSSWSFPSNYNVFSDFNTNRKITFRFDSVYDPSAHGVVPVGHEQESHDILAANLAHEFIVTIEEGYYTPDQMATELQTKFNAAVNYFLLETDSSFATAVNAYSAFRIVYNEVQQKLWFGNERDQFVMVNDSVVFAQTAFLDSRCAKRNVLPEYVNWGLPSFLGFTRCSETAKAPEYSAQLVQSDSNVAPYDADNSDPISVVPRMYSSTQFFYLNPTDPSTPDPAYPNQQPGMWLLPNSTLIGSTAFFLRTPMKINLMGHAYFYMEITGLNCLDETSPYNLSKFTTTTNQTNGIVNSAFAKLSIPTTPVSQWYDDTSPSYKWFNPPAKRIRKLKVKLRYHNGQILEMGDFDYSFMLEFNMMRPQMERKSSVFKLH